MPDARAISPEEAQALPVLDQDPAGEQSEEWIDPNAETEEETPDETSDEGQDESEQPEIDDPTLEENIPEELRPMWRSAQAVITRNLQQLAEQKKALGPAAQLAEMLEAQGVPLDQLIETLSQPPSRQEYAPATASLDYDADPWVQRLTAGLESASTEAESLALEYQIEQRKETLQRDAARAYQDYSASLQSELSTLKADPRYRDYLKTPQDERALIQFRSQRGHPSLESAMRDMRFDDLQVRGTKATKKAFEDGRRGREKAKESSIETSGRNAEAVARSAKIEYKKGARLQDLFEDGVSKGILR